MIVVSEFGINPGPIHAAELYASKGFVAIVPEIFFRDRQRVLSVEAQSIAAGRVMRLAALSNSADEIVKDERMVEQLAAVAEHLVRDPRVIGRRISVLGGRLGARIAFGFAARKPEWTAACVGMHPIFPASILDYVSSLESPVRLVFVESDPTLTPDAIDRLRAELDYQKKDYGLELLSGAEGTFMISDSPGFDSELTDRCLVNDMRWLRSKLG